MVNVLILVIYRNDQNVIKHLQSWKIAMCTTSQSFLGLGLLIFANNSCIFQTSYIFVSLL